MTKLVLCISLLMIISGCTQPQDQIPQNEVRNETSSSAAETTQTQAVAPVTKEDYEQQLNLPNGEVVRSDAGTFTYNGVDVNLHYYVHNHTQIVGQEEIDTQYGGGKLVLLVQTPPAACNCEGEQWMYNVILDVNVGNGKQVPFILEGKVNGDKDTVRKTVLELVKYWKIHALEH